MANDSSLNPHSSGDDSRRELYDRFRSELATNRSSLYFDEEELVELYDYASDLRDRYTALEVLFCGERLYPSSVALAERKVLFYLAIDDEAAVAALETLPDDSVIKRLTALRVARTGPEEARRELDSLLATKAELNDEEIIQICDTAEELGLYSWLIDNRSKIAALTDYPPIFLYELCQIAQSQDPDEALKILEELTMMEPFSIDFWLLTAQIYFEQSSPSKALPAVEYALAIEPDNLRALMMKAHVYNELDYPAEQVEEVLDEVIMADPDMVSPYLAKAMVYARSGRAAEGMEIIRDYNMLHPGNPQTLDVMLLLADLLPDEKLPDLHEFLTPAMSEYADNFIDMARRHADEGRHRSAARLLLGVEDAYRLKTDFDFMMEELYRSGMYAEAITAYQYHFRDSDANKGAVVQVSIDELNDCFAAFWFILSAIRAGATDGIAHMVESLIASQLNGVFNSTVDDILESRGLMEYLLKINAYIKGTDPLTPDDLDPFVETPDKKNHESNPPE